MISIGLVRILGPRPSDLGSNRPSQSCIRRCPNVLQHAGGKQDPYSRPWDFQLQKLRKGKESYLDPSLELCLPACLTCPPALALTACPAPPRLPASSACSASVPSVTMEISYKYVNITMLMFISIINNNT